MTTQRPDVPKDSFARTNRQTIDQRVALIQEFLPDCQQIAELCCGDCQQQALAYSRLGIRRYVGVDIEPEIVALNRQQGIECLQSDVLSPALVTQLLAMDLLFFGPPLSVNCDGHQLLPFHLVTPTYAEFLTTWVVQGNFRGTIVCICPKTTTMGDMQQCYHQIRPYGFSLRLIHHSYATVTGQGATTHPRLKYSELWFSTVLGDLWEIRESYPLV